VFLIFLVSALLGIVLMLVWRFFGKDFFAGRTLNRSTPTLVPEQDERAPAPPVYASSSLVEMMTALELRVSGHLSPAGSQGRHGTGAPERRPTWQRYAPAPALDPSDSPA
jgi:hypothetical protein